MKTDSTFDFVESVNTKWALFCIAASRMTPWPLKPPIKASTYDYTVQYIWVSQQSMASISDFIPFADYIKD